MTEEPTTVEPRAGVTFPAQFAGPEDAGVEHALAGVALSQSTGPASLTR